MNSPGIIMPTHTGVDFDCPFCAQRCSLVVTTARVLHYAPMCDAFRRLDPDDFLRRAEHLIGRTPLDRMVGHLEKRLGY